MKFELNIIKQKAEKSSFFSHRFHSVLGHSNHLITEISFQNEDEWNNNYSSLKLKLKTFLREIETGLKEIYDDASFERTRKSFWVTLPTRLIT